MSKIRLLPFNLWRGGTIISQSSQNPQFPAIDTQIDTKQMFWRSLTIEKLTDGGLNEWESATDLTHWIEYKVGSSTVNREATEKIEGDYSCRLDIDASDNIAQIQQTNINLTPEAKCKIRLSYMMSASGKIALIEIKDSSSTVYLDSNGDWGGYTVITLANSTDWLKFELDFYAHADYSNYIVTIKKKTPALSSSIYFDKCSLTECPSISCDLGEFSPAGIGLLNFDSGSVVPVVGEWLFGEEAKGKVVSVSGTVTGSIVLEKCEGCFNDNEEIRGSIGGANMLTVNQPDGAVGVDKHVKNGAFVSTADEWASVAEVTLTNEAGGQTGNCMKIALAGTVNEGASQTFGSLIVGKIYTLNFYYKVIAGDTMRIRDDTVGFYIFNDLVSVAWTELSYTFEATATSKVISWRCKADGDITYLDEVSLYELDEDDTEKKADFIAILGHNFSQTAEIKAIGSMESDFSDTVEEVVIPYNEGDIFYFFPSAVTRRYWKVEVTDADNPDGYIQEATISLGKSFEPEWSYIKPHSEGKDIASEFEFTDSMVLYAHEKPTRKVWLLNFRLTEAEKDKVLELIEENENHKAFIACFDSDNPNSKSCLVKLRAVEEPEYISYDRWRWEAPIIEVL
ncbi:hypothetical protein ES703_42171 [subsurface metagenome]